jgi:TPR repeat protein
MNDEFSAAAEKPVSPIHHENALDESVPYEPLFTADQNRPDGQFNSGICLRDGLGVPIDLPGAARYFKLAADQNHADAQFNYAICLRDGMGVLINLGASAKYFKLAADQNHSAAQSQYGVCLLKGLGVRINLSEAAQYSQAGG